MYTIYSFYKFFVVDSIAETETRLRAAAEQHAICGLIILAPEGINGTIAGTEEGTAEFTKLLHTQFGLEPSELKASESTVLPYKRFSLRIREEIVTSGTEVSPLTQSGAQYLTPAEWHQRLSLSPPVVIDVRNTYETQLGMFEGALDPGTRNFSEFPEYVRESGIAKDTPILMYCTGGIRCEKAALEMTNQGYTEVYQLHGGILRYLEEFPEGYFKGECFVFDRRVAVDQQLRESQTYRLCPHCGDPGKETISCGNCSKSAVLCQKCLSEETCSKDCAYHFNRKKAA